MYEAAYLADVQPKNVKTDYIVEVKIQWSEENLVIASDFKYYVIVLGRQRKNWQTSLSYFASGSSISLSSWFIGFKAD